MQMIGRPIQNSCFMNRSHVSHVQYPFHSGRKSKQNCSVSRMNLWLSLPNFHIGQHPLPVVKQDGTVRICGDYKVTINRALKLEVYPLPRIEELFTALAGGEQFSKLDLSHAYQQLVLEEESRKLVIITTHKGLFKYNRLPYGVATAP